MGAQKLMQLVKYVFNIRCTNGAVVNNLRINGYTREEAESKVRQMYRHCEILDTEATQTRAQSYSYDDVLDILCR
jgi:hypothetical protein